MFLHFLYHHYCAELTQVTNRKCIISNIYTLLKMQLADIETQSEIGESLLLGRTGERTLIVCVTLGALL